MTDKKTADEKPAKAPVRPLREWAAIKSTPEWQVRAAETVAALTGVESDALNEHDFDAAIERVL